MQRDPSGGKGRRTATRPTGQTEGRPMDDFERPPITRAGVGGLMVVLAIVAGFGVGSEIGSAEDASQPPVAALSAASGSDFAVVTDVTDFGVAETMLAAHTPSDRPSVDARGLAVAVPVANRLSMTTPAVTHAAMPPSGIAIDDLPIHRTPPVDDPVEHFTIVTRGEIASGESLGASLRRQGISPGTVHLIAREMRKVFDFRHSRPGDTYRLGQDAEGRVLDFRYAQSPEESFYLAWNGTRYVVEKETAELRPLVAKIAGIVDSSFYGAVLALGERSALASEFARILAWDIDFSRQVHPGDEFQILYERLYRTNDDGEDVYVRPGRILAGRYTGRTGAHTVVYFEDQQGEGAYFRPDGSSIERAFLAAPLEFSRISSRFTGARRHPILNVTRPHRGIDYAAAHGTPIWSVADGVVEYRARAGASGNLIRIRHKGGLTSHYAHLASFAKNLKVGTRVEQKQIIGYVGTTGLSTGPHVCFRVKKDGVYVDPMKIGGPAGEPVAKSRLAIFRSVRDQLLADLGGGTSPGGTGPLAMADEAL